MADATVQLAPLPAGSIVAQDDFATGGSPGDAILAITPIAGGVWGYSSFFPGSLVISGASPRGIRARTANTPSMIVLGSASSPDYSVRVGFYMRSVTPGGGTYSVSACGRVDGPGSTFYAFTYTLTATTGITVATASLVVFYSGSSSTLASAPVGILSANTGPHYLELRISGTSLTGLIDGFAAATASNSTITAAGRPGLMLSDSTTPSDSTGFEVTWFSCDTLDSQFRLAAIAVSAASTPGTTLGPLAASGGLPAPSVALDSVRPAGALPAPAALPAAGVARDWSSALPPLPAAARATPILAAAGTAGALSPLASAPALPALAYSTTTDAPVAVNALPASAGLAANLVGTGRTTALAPLAAAGRTPALYVTAGSGVSTRLSPLPAPAGLPPVSLMTAGSATLGMSALAAPAGLPPRVAEPAAESTLAPGALASRAQLLLASSTTLTYAVGPLRAPAHVASRTPVGEAYLAPGALPAAAGLLASAITPITMVLARPGALAADARLALAGGTARSGAAAVLAPLAAEVGLSLGGSGGVVVYIDQAAWARLGPGELDSNYPFVNPSLDVRRLIGEANFTYRTRRYAPPLRIAWIGGLDRAFNLPGGLPTTPPYIPPGESPAASDAVVPDYTRVHACDAVLMDAEDQIVFDSRQADAYAGSYYGPYLYCHRWTGPDGVLRITQRTAFPAQAEAYQVPASIKPRNAIFDERVSEVAGRMLDSLGFTGTVAAVDHAGLSGGWNTTVASKGQARSGLLRTAVVAIGAAPGSGDGRYPGCADEQPIVAAIGDAAADDFGNLRLSGDGCYQLRPEVRVVDGAASVTPGKLLLGGQCTACCSCEDYAGLAVQVVRLWNELQAAAADAEASRDVFGDGVARWRLLQPEGPPPWQVRARALAHNLHYIDLVVQVCHMTDACLRNFAVEVEAIVQGDNLQRTRVDLVPDAVTMNTLCGTAERAPIARTSQTSAGGPILIHDVPPPVAGVLVLTLNWDAIQPRTSGVARLRYTVIGLDYDVPTDVLFNLRYADGSQSFAVTLVEAP